jgi:hypothetical protein
LSVGVQSVRGEPDEKWIAECGDDQGFIMVHAEGFTALAALRAAEGEEK